MPAADYEPEKVLAAIDDLPPEQRDFAVKRLHNRALAHVSGLIEAMTPDDRRALAAKLAPKHVRDMTNSERAEFMRKHGISKR